MQMATNGHEGVTRKHYVLARNKYLLFGRDLRPNIQKHHANTPLHTHIYNYSYGWRDIIPALYVSIALILMFTHDCLFKTPLYLRTMASIWVRLRITLNQVNPSVISR